MRTRTAIFDSTVIMIACALLLAGRAWADEADAGAPAPSTEPALAPTGALEPPPPADTGGGLSLDSPDLGAPPPAGGGAAAGGGGLVFGGTIDYRIFFPNDMKQGMYEIHVNELFFTTNIGDHISILAEQLLLTSDLGTSAGQDHGFVYVTLSELPFLLDGMAIRMGRMRLRYGIDAKLDAPANPLRTPEYRTLGALSDRAIEISGYYAWFDYVAAIAMGPDFVLRDVVGADGLVAGSIKTETVVDLHPMYLRLGTDWKGRAPNFGLSFFYGDTYPVLAADGFQAGDAMLFGGFLDQHRVVRKQRASADVRWRWKKLGLAGEYTFGRDREGSSHVNVQAAYLRADYTITPQKLAVQLQYDRFLDGRPGSRAIGSGGVSLTYNVTDQSWLRAFFQTNERVFAGEGAAWLAGTQLLFAY